MAAIYNLPELPYKLNALEPYITEREMDVHYNSHHKTYATKQQKHSHFIQNFHINQLKSILLI
eukprot:gnl/Chilomastix_caulleri/2372.p2 GENE.gnl/Chilomastix_caulleri/2372~~gnl/Chilomastix_caulleri/2372.p2  ORF type:complete len:63 (+),score=4.66 gnl/Chilomastix_caulleri/2372:70-258(+)